MEKHMFDHEERCSRAQRTRQTTHLLVRMLWQSGPVLTLLIILFIFIEGAVPALQLYASKQIIDGIAPNGLESYAARWSIVYACSLVLLSIVNAAQTWLKMLLSERSVITVNSVLLDAFERIPGMRFFEEEKHRNRLEALRDRSNWLPAQLLNFSASMCTSVFSAIGIIMLIAVLSPMLSIILVLSTAPFAFMQNRYNEMEWQYAKEYAVIRRRLDYTRSLVISRRAAKEIRLFGLGSHFHNIYQHTFALLYEQFRMIQAKSAKGTVFTGLFSGMVAGGAYFWVVSQSGSGSISLGDIALYLGAVFQLSVSLREIAKEGADTIDIWRMGNDFVLFMNAEEDIQKPSHPIPVNAGPLSIEFKGVSFKYPYQEQESAASEEATDDFDLDLDSEEIDDENEDEVHDYAEDVYESEDKRSPWVLDHISFSISPGERIAIVGANGSGKTTLVKLLCRFYEFCEGEIKINGVDIRSFDVRELREHISVVFQEFGKYELSLRENIMIGSPNTQLSDREINQALQDSRLDQIVSALPHGIETLLGPEWGGTDFSGGQWQRVALARAMVRQAGLVILDEPAASLDIRAEYEIFNQFQKMTKGKTVIMISHRFSTVKLADRILVLKNGCIVEEGSHEALMCKNGEYATMFRLQGKSFQGEEHIQ
ncbi:ABC transporter ATP-binding protein [Paenibacillus sp. M2]|uniref:ABC transporter ATP-binding protein n=1 Tax=Paenibacillus sp. M2 TaxID=3341793 RepID=UPI003989CB5F